MNTMTNNSITITILSIALAIILRPGASRLRMETV